MVSTVLVARRTDHESPMRAGRDFWLDDEMKAGHGFARLDLEKTQAKLEALMTPEQLAEARKGK